MFNLVCTATKCQPAAGPMFPPPLPALSPSVSPPNPPNPPTHPHLAGLIAQQQCVGPLQLPISDVAVMAQTHFGYTGSATAIGEQPIKGLIDPAAMARLALGEALTNLVGALSLALQQGGLPLFA